MSIDDTIVKWLNEFSSRESLINLAVTYISSAAIFKGGVSVALLWGAWARGGRVTAQPVLIWRLMLGTVAALVASRLIQNTFPARARPMMDPALAMSPPYGFNADSFSEWSSFPSDNATLFAALATATFIMHRKIGIASFMHTIFVISLPRLYLGLHYPSDILSGAAIGIAMVILTSRINFPEKVTSAVEKTALKYPSWHMFCLYLLTFGCATMFDDIRALTVELWERL